MTASWAVFMMVACFLIAILYGYMGFLLGISHAKQQILEGMHQAIKEAEEKNGKV